MDEPIIELTPEWLEFQNLLKEVIDIPSSSSLSIKELKNIISDKKNELYNDNYNSINR